jgi:peptidoglycan hydrolase-like protein with peptidoglycan-binding domain
MELLAYIQEEFVCDDQAIATADNISTNANMETTFQTWLKKLTTKSAKLSLNVILASTTLLIGLGSTLNAIAEVTPSSDVKYVQSLLAKNGFDPGTIDGVAGASTKNAIIRAQQSLGLTPDGVAGSRTIAALENGAPVAKVEAKASESDATSASVPSSSVMNLQKLLADRGFYNGAVDGIMGNQTRNAIIAAQKAYNLTPDGVAGPQTIAALESDGSKTATIAISTSNTSTTKSTEVANLQELLSKRGFYNGAVDGIMGNQTRSAIIAAQKNYGLTADGIAGSKTIAALESGSSKVNIAAQNTTTTTEPKDAVKASDNNVVSVQQLLTKRGFYNGAIDGIKGNQTKSAIIAAQKAYGLTPDGIAGAQTVAALQKDVPTSSTTTKATAPTTQATKSSAATDENVANLQNLLTDRGFYSGPITGFLGPRTKAAIISAQKAYGLTPDGVAGAQTIAALESGSPRQQQITVNNTPTVRVQPQVVTPQATPQPQLEPKIQVQPQAPQVQPQSKATQPATQATPQATAQPQATVKPQVQPTPATPIATATAKPQASASNAQVVELQNLLAKRGFYNGKADGVLTAETRNAIVRAQNFYTIAPADGSPSNKLIDSLSKDTFISEGN